MKRWLMAVWMAAALLALALPVPAADFGWMKDFNIQAQADPTGFRARLATRFKIGNAHVDAVVSNVPDPVDAYMVFRMGEISHHPPEKVLDVYKARQGKGWGVIAKELGIKPGSKAFQALKKGHDFGKEYGGGKKAAKPKGKDKGRDKSRERGDPEREAGKGRGGR